MTLGTSERPIEILFMEDNPADVELTQRALAKSEYSHNWTVAEDGEEAMAMLRREGEHAGVPRPDLILLDLNLPKKSGQEVLAEMHEDPDLATIPVMILTGTEAERSLLESYNIPPNRYCRKPMDVSRFKLVATSLKVFSAQPLLVGARAQQAPQAAAQSEPKKGWWPFGR